MAEYNKLKKQFEEEDEEEKEVEEEDDEEDGEEDDEEDDNILGFRKPQKKFECPICHGLGTMVNDHDHAIQFNNFRGIAHAHCNIQYLKNYFAIPIWAHNGLKYDFHFVLEL